VKETEMLPSRSDRSARNKQASTIAEELRRVLPDLLVDIALQQARPNDLAALDQAIQSVDAATVLEILRQGMRSLAPKRPATKKVAARRVRGNLGR